MKKIILFTILGPFGISAGAQDTTGCALIANFTYTVSGETLSLTNTSTDEPFWPFYSWTVDGLISSLENPTFPTTDFETSAQSIYHLYITSAGSPVDVFVKNMVSSDRTKVKFVITSHPVLS